MRRLLTLPDAAGGLAQDDSSNFTRPTPIWYQFFRGLFRLLFSVSESSRNSIARNGDFVVKQFGSAFTNFTGGFAADRWYVTATANNTIAFVANPIAGNGCRYGLRLRRTAAQTWTNTCRVAQVFTSEESHPYAGKTVVFSIFGLAGANCSNTTLNISIVSGTGTDETSANHMSWTGRTVFATTSFVMTAAGEQGLVTGTVPATATQIAILVDWTPVGTADADDSITLTGADFRAGDFTPSTFEQKTTAREITDCSMFYEDMALNPITGGPWLRVLAHGHANGAGGGAGTDQNLIIAMRFRAKRNNTHTLTVGGSGSWHVTYDGGGSIWDLLITGGAAQWSHQSMEDALLLARYVIGVYGTAGKDQHPALANSTGFVLAVDGASDSKFAIDCNL